MGQLQRCFKWHWQFWCLQGFWYETAVRNPCCFKRNKAENRKIIQHFDSVLGWVPPPSRPATKVGPIISSASWISTSTIACFKWCCLSSLHQCFGAALGIPIANDIQNWFHPWPFMEVGQFIVWILKIQGTMGHDDCHVHCFRTTFSSHAGSGTYRQIPKYLTWIWLPKNTCFENPQCGPLEGDFPMFLLTLYFPIFFPSSPECGVSQGTRGCKNQKAGGDTVNWSGENSEGQLYMTYVVYRSFKVPPPIKKSGLLKN